MSGELVRRDTDSWVEMLPAVGDLATKISDTEFVPTAFRKKPAAIAAAILAGRELGLSPMTALQHVSVIEGRPTLSAQMQRALALSQGHEIHYVEVGSTRCVVEGRRKGSEEWTRVTWSMDDARKAGLAGRQNWVKHPRRMLEARATAELCQLLFADAVGGIPLTTEEALDDTEGPGPQLDAQASPKPERTARRRTAPAAPPVEPPPLPEMDIVEGELVDTETGEIPEPSWEAPPPKSEQVVPPGQSSDAQRVAIRAKFTEIGVRDDAERKRIISQLVGRPIDHMRYLSSEDASAVLDTLSMALDQDNPALTLSSLLSVVAKVESEGAQNG